MKRMIASDDESLTSDATFLHMGWGTAAVSGAVSGAISTIDLPVRGVMIANGLITGVASAAQQVVDAKKSHTKPNPRSIATRAVKDGAWGAIGSIAGAGHSVQKTSYWKPKSKNAKKALR